MPSVIDGDTIDVRVGGQGTVSVRLLGINTPEVAGPYRTAQCFGNEASANAKRLLAGATVYLQDDPQQDDKDQYGRWLRYVWMSDGRLFNLGDCAGVCPGIHLLPRAALFAQPRLP